MGKILNINPAPIELIKACGGFVDEVHKPDNLAAPSIEVANKGAVQRATSYLKNAEPSIEGAGGDANALQVAMFVKDMGVDPGTALELMLEHWNERCSPPWTADELQRKIDNAYRYGKAPAGANSPEADFEPLPPEVDKKSTGDDLAHMDPKPTRVLENPVRCSALANDIPARAWLLGRQLLKHKISVMIAPGGEGKSTLALAMAVSIITGRKDLTGLDVHETGPVLVINNEDDLDEINRRVKALEIKQLIDNGSLQDLHIKSGVENPFLIARRTKDGIIKPVDKDWLIHYVIENGIKLVIVDPFIETHYVDENNNEEISQVGRLYREVAVRADCSILIVHHTRKPPSGGSDSYVGDMNSGRGASALTGIARIMYTLYGMSAKDAKAYGIKPQDRNKYVRLDDAKANLSLASHTARWFRKESVLLPNGDETGVLVPEESLELVAQRDETIILDAVRTALARSWAKSGHCMPVQVAATLAREAVIEDISEKTARRRLEELLDTPVMFEGWELSIEPKDPGENIPGIDNRTKHLVRGRRVISDS